MADIHDYPLFLLVGLIVWVFFAQALLAAAPSLVQNAPLVRKVRFPRETIPASAAVVQLVTFLVMLVLLAAGGARVRGTLDPALLLLPVVVLRCSASCSGCRWPCRSCTRTTATSSRCSPRRCCRGSSSRRSSSGSRTCPGVADHEWLGDLLEWANPIAPFMERVREVLYAGAAPTRARCLHRRAAALGALAAGCCVFRRMERDLAVML